MPDCMPISGAEYRNFFLVCNGKVGERMHFIVDLMFGCGLGTFIANNGRKKIAQGWKLMFLITASLESQFGLDRCHCSIQSQIS